MIEIENINKGVFMKIIELNSVGCGVNENGVTFPMMTKVKVKGLNKHPLYQFLTQKAKNNYKDSRVTWNFQKYLIHRDGMVEKIISPKARPDSEEVISWITNGE